MIIAKKKVMSKVLAATLGAAGALAVANNASADTQVQVASGDTVWGFAQQYSTTIDSISTANQLANPNLIYVGQQLVIPTSAISAASSAANVALPTSASNTAASQAASQTTKPTTIAAAASASAVSQTNAFNIADQAQPATVAAASVAPTSTANSTVTVEENSAAPQPTAQSTSNQVDTVAYNVSASQANTAAANNANTITLTTNTNNNAAAIQTTEFTANATVANPQSTAAVSATPAPQSAASQGNGSTSSAVATAKSMIGVPYVWGGNTPSGFDCSGLVQYSYGLDASHRTTYQQTNLGAHHYDVQNAQSGDLYFWGTDSAPYHVAIAEGNGQYIQAPQPGQNVQQGDINYYRPSYYISMN